MAKITHKRRRHAVGVLSLFTSSLTLVCCALPVAVSAIAGTAAVVALINNVPWLVALSYYKYEIFIIAAVLLCIDGIMLYYPHKKQKACPVNRCEACETGKNWSKIIFVSSVIIYLIGFFFAFLLPHLLGITAASLSV